MNTLTPAQVAEALQVHRSTITRLCKNGRIKAFRLPGCRSHYRIDEDELQRLRAGLSEKGLNTGQK